MVDIYNASLADILPQSLKIDKQFIAVAKALDPLLKKFAYDTRKAMHLPRLDELEGTILDVLAEQFHCDYYNSAVLDDEQKRNLIRQSIALHRLKGTVWAVETVANQFFLDPQVIELEGFLFRLRVREYTAALDAFDTFYRMLIDAKPVRSWLVSIDFDISPPPQKIFIGNPFATTGNVKIGNLQPKPAKAKVFLGCPFIVTGKISF